MNKNQNLIETLKFTSVTNGEALTTVPSKTVITENIINETIQACLSDGCDRFIVITQYGEIQSKDYNRVSKNDIIYYKVILTWHGSNLDYKLIEYDEPFKIVLRIKNKNERPKSVYLCLHLLYSNEYTFNSQQNRKRFKNFIDIKQYYEGYSFYCKEDRDYLFGIA